ncbi:MAG: acyltransferase [Spirochaetia bacterium]|nr:acyltransferase [Spirochaetia bacterium]
MEETRTTLSKASLDQSSSRLHYIAVLRVLATFVVVAFHTYGYMYANHFPQSKERYNAIYFVANQCVFINVAMPLFTAISGYLFAWLFLQGKYQNYWQMIRKKAMRLLLPFVVFGTLLMATTGVPFRPWMLYRGSISHLWYLTALFWCFVVGGVTQRYFNRLWQYGGVCIILLFTNGLVPYIPRILGLQYLFCQYEWFLLGQVLATFHDTIFKAILKWHLSIPLMFPFAVMAWIFPDPYVSERIQTYFMISSFLVGLFPLVEFLCKKVTSKTIKPLEWLGKYTFGIYIFHNWLGPYMISRTAKRLLNLEPLALDHVVLFPLLLTVAILVVSFFIAWLLTQTRVGRMLMG